MEEKLNPLINNNENDQILSELSIMVAEMASRIKFLERSVAFDSHVLRNVQAQISSLTSNMEITYSSLVDKLKQLLEKQSPISQTARPINTRSVGVETSLRNSNQPPKFNFVDASTSYHKSFGDHRTKSSPTLESLSSNEGSIYLDVESNIGSSDIVATRNPTKDNKSNVSAISYEIATFSMGNSSFSNVSPNHKNISSTNITANSSAGKDCVPILRNVQSGILNHRTNSVPVSIDLNPRKVFTTTRSIAREGNSTSIFERSVTFASPFSSKDRLLHKSPSTMIYSPFSGSQDVSTATPSCFPSSNLKDAANLSPNGKFVNSNAHSKANPKLVSNDKDNVSSNISPTCAVSSLTYTENASTTTITPNETSIAINSTKPTLLTAAQSGDVETLLFLLEADANVSERTEDGDSPLHLAAQGGHESAVMVLIGAGAVVNASGRQQRTPLHLAATRGHKGVAKRLLVGGAQTENKDVVGDTPLILASRNGHAGVVSLLMQANANVNCVDKDGRTPIMWAALKGNAEVVGVLLSKVSLVEKDKNGDTALLLAAKAEHWQIVEIMVKTGFAVETPDKKGQTLMELAAKAQQWGVLKILKQQGLVLRSKIINSGRNDPLIQAVENGNTKALRDLLFLIDYNDEELEIAFSFVKDPVVVRIFSERAKRIVRSEVGLEVMWRAAKLGNVELLISVLDAGVDVNARNSFRNTALHYASYNGHYDCVKVLLERGALKNARGNRGRTPLFDACEQGNEECVQLLLAAGAYAKLKNDEGRTPMEVAKNDFVRKQLANYLDRPLCIK